MPAPSLPLIDGSVLIFVLGLVAVTGVGLVKGGQLTSADKGMSVGSVASSGGTTTEGASSLKQTPSPKTSALPYRPRRLGPRPSFGGDAQPRQT